eukprot:Pgem_evm1s4244
MDTDKSVLNGSDGNTEYMNHSTKTLVYNESNVFDQDNYSQADNVYQIDKTGKNDEYNNTNEEDNHSLKYSNIENDIGACVTEEYEGTCDDNFKYYCENYNDKLKDFDEYYNTSNVDEYEDPNCPQVDIDEYLNLPNNKLTNTDEYDES